MATATEIAEGLRILDKYVESYHYVSAEHEVIYAGPGEQGSWDDPVRPEEYIDDDDLERLDELGWFFNEDIGCFQRFV